MNKRLYLFPASLCFLLSLGTASAAIWEALPRIAPAPADNPQTPEKIELGKKLFFDPRLSKTGTISCNSCHNLMGGGDDMRPNSIGHNGQKGGRSSPTVWNAAFLSTQFWDGRAATLEEQAKGPITNPIEMAMDGHDVAVKRVSEIPGYVTEFKKVFGGGTPPVTIDRVAQAIASFERTLITPDSAFDRFVRGKATALTAQQKRGMETALKVGCTSCHSGANFSGPAFQKFPLLPGTEYEKKYRLAEDTGRHQVTKNDADKHFWRVPTLRNVALTAPYFHNGAVKTLDEAVRVMAKTQLNRELSKDETSDIVAFLGALTGEFPQISMPRLPELRGRSQITE